MNFDPSFSAVLNWLISAVALIFTAAIVPGFRVKNYGVALITALVIGLANYWIRPLLLFLTLPLNLLTLGLFTFVVNGMILKLCSALLRDFVVETWFAAIAGAFLFALTQTLLYWFLPF